MAINCGSVTALLKLLQTRVRKSVCANSVFPPQSFSALLMNLRILKERRSSSSLQSTKAFLSPAGTGSCSGSAARCQQDDLWLRVLGGGWTWSHCHSGPKRSTAWPDQRPARTLKYVTMHVIKVSRREGKGRGPKTVLEKEKACRR